MTTDKTDIPPRADNRLYYALAAVILLYAVTVFVAFYLLNARACCCCQCKMQTSSNHPPAQNRQSLEKPTMKTLRPMALAAALFAGTPALAVSTDLGVLGNFGEGFGNIFVQGAPLFSDAFQFTLLAPAAVGGNAGQSGIGLFGLVLKDADGDTLAADATPASFTFPGLAAGQYELNFVGFGAAAGGFYGGNVAVTTIPEPETYALMLAGLAAGGFMARRRM